MRGWQKVMVSTSCWQCDTCTSEVLRLGMGARDGFPRVAEAQGDARRSWPKESGMDHWRRKFSGGSETWCVRARRESSSCVGANSALSEDFLKWIDSVFLEGRL